MTNWENKGEGKQDENYFSCHYLLFLLFPPALLEQGMSRSPGCSNHRLALTTMEPKNITVTTPSSGAWNRMEQRRGQKKLSVLGEKFVPAETVGKPLKSPNSPS